MNQQRMTFKQALQLLRRDSPLAAGPRMSPKPTALAASQHCTLVALDAGAVIEQEIARAFVQAPPREKEAS